MQSSPVEPSAHDGRYLSRARVSNGIRQFNREYEAILYSGDGHLTDDFWSLLDDASVSEIPDIRHVAGDIAVEAAVKITEIPSEKEHLFNFARRYWDLSVDTAETAQTTDTHTLETKVNQATGRSFETIALEEQLPDKTIVNRMYLDLVDVAEESLDYWDYLVGQPAYIDPSRLKGDLTGFQAELAVLLLYQRFGLMVKGLGQLALPSMYSEDHGLSGHTKGDKLNAWDVSIHQTDHGELSIPIKIQVKANRKSGKRKPWHYADEIDVIRVAEDIGMEDLTDCFTPGWILRNLVNEVADIRRGSNSTEDVRQRDETWEILDTMIERLLEGVQ